MRKRLVVILLFGALGMLFTACQNADPDTEGQAVSALTPVSLQLQWFTQAQFAGYYVALDKGWYRDEGLDMSIFPGGPDLVPVDLVTSGAKDFGTTLLADLTVSIGQGKPAVSIAQIQQNNGLRLLTKTASGIREPRDFTGKKVGVWLGGWEVQFNALVVGQGIDLKDVNVISQGFSMTPFIEGQLDVASAMIYNEYFMVLAGGIDPQDIHVIDYADYELDFPGDVLFTSRQMTEKRPQICRKVLNASLKGWEYALNHPQEAVDIVLKYDRAGIQKRSHQLKMMDEIANLVKGEAPGIGHPDPGAVSRMVQLLVDSHILKTRIESQRIYSTRFLE
ncbi:MAG: myristoyl transferase [Desulfobacteraceae bacterium]|nr:MAG: myristoyl transferase [Desulfobacteraceae bacterium]